MKTHFKLLFIVISLLFAGLAPACTHKESTADDEFNSLMATLESEMDRSDFYDSIKCVRIDEIKHQLANAGNTSDKIHYINRLIEEYESFVSDSAMHYVVQNIRMAEEARNTYEETRLNILRADILAHAGIFNASARILSDIEPESLTPDLLASYYDASRSIMQYEYEYLGETETGMKKEIDSLRHESIIKIIEISDPSSFVYVVSKSTQFIDAGKSAEAIEYIESKLPLFTSGTRKHAILTSLLAGAYELSGNMAKREHYLILSAISDIRASVKENTSMRELAKILYAKGEFERANHCLKKSIADANFFSARMRGAQAGRLIPVIDASYDATQRDMSNKLKLYIGIISILAIVLALAAVLILKQLRSLRKTHRKMKRTSEELEELYKEVRSANSDLTTLNQSLEESNKIKEEYVARFMNYCSVSISTLEQYQNTLNVLAQSGDKAALVKRIKSNKVVDIALREFYQMFDHAFLNIFPTFVDDFNKLLLPDYRVSVHEGDRQLNTELRTFALIRLGITDSAKISQFLRCSITTIYTYRSKMRKRAIVPETFEDDAAAIASI